MGDDRRRRIIEILQGADGPVTGSELAATLKVSRQVIVQDVAMLRAAGGGIIATPQGYLLPSNVPVLNHKAVLACRHEPRQTEEELNVLVDHGVKVVDVVVEHPLYGELRGLLMVQTRADVREFLSRMAATEAGLLSTLTKGVHLHTVECARQTSLDQAIEALRAAGFLVQDERP